MSSESSASGSVSSGQQVVYEAMCGKTGGFDVAVLHVHMIHAAPQYSGGESYASLHQCRWSQPGIVDIPHWELINTTGYFYLAPPFSCSLLKFMALLELEIAVKLQVQSSNYSEVLLVYSVKTSDPECYEK